MSEALKFDDGKLDVHLLGLKAVAARVGWADETLGSILVTLAMWFDDGMDGGLSDVMHYMETRYGLQEVLDATHRAMVHGAEKYGRENWKQSGGLAWSRLVASAFRHALACCMDLSALDPDSGLRHFDHLCASLWFLYSYSEGFVHADKDDRPSA